MPRDPGHWGQFGQEDIYPVGTVLERRPYKAPKAAWDHDHCIFCWAKFVDPHLSEASRRAIQGDPEILTSGYTKESVGEWVCPSCFDEFAERFGWSKVSG